MSFTRDIAEEGYRGYCIRCHADRPIADPCEAWHPNRQGSLTRHVRGSCIACGTTVERIVGNVAPQAPERSERIEPHIPPHVAGLLSHDACPRCGGYIDLRLDDRNPLYREARCIHCGWAGDTVEADGAEAVA